MKDGKPWPTPSQNYNELVFERSSVEEALEKMGLSKL